MGAQNMEGRHGTSSLKTGSRVAAEKDNGFKDETYLSLNPWIQHIRFLDSE